MTIDGTFRWISLTTDYGLSDGFVAACHGVIARHAPGVRVIDVTHLVPPGDIARGATVLAQTVPHLPLAVHVAIVDPGVGTARRAIAVETGRGALVGPDNGLLPRAADALGGVRRVVELTNPRWLAEAVSATFHGRDVFAPAAARLAIGADLADAGPEVDPTSLVRLPEPSVTIGDGFIEAEVIMVDRFGNVQLAAPAEALSGLGTRLTIGGIHAVRGATFDDAGHGELIAFADSAGQVGVAINGGQAAVALSVSAGDVLRIVSR
jgi:S-adenosylmethionine hydrolase